MIRRWRPSLRMARREVLRHKTRTLLSVILIMVPVLVATVVALYAHNLRYEGEHQARVTMGGADALVQITPYTKAKVGYPDGWMYVRPGETVRGKDGKKHAVRRPVTDVDLTSLLPDGTRIVAAPTSRQAELPSGGTAYLQFLDGDDPLVEGLFPGIDGRAPEKADEAAIRKSMAEELGLLDDGKLQTDASMTLADGTVLHVVGLVKPETWSDATTEATVVLSPLNPAAPKAPREWLLDLPPLGTQDTRSLVQTLADHGVAMMPRDAVLHPRGQDTNEPGPVDYQALAIGALVILVGLIEVVLVVGAAFAVGARRQVRDLGLLAASGGAPSDIRRSLLAQGCVLGIGGSLLGVAAGTGTFLASIPAYEAIRHERVWTDDLSVAALLVILALGSVTGIVAALVPAWSISRLTPVAALAGRFPVRSGESTAHRGAFVLSGLGIAVLALAGLWISSAFSTSRDESVAVSPLPVALAGLGFLMLAAGVVWMSPYAVRRIAALGKLLPLSGRYSFRDAARHRFRTAAAAIALTITVAAAVLVGFGVTAATAAQRAESSMPPHSLIVNSYTRSGADPGAVLATVERILGPVEMYSSDGVRGPKGQYADLWMSLGAARCSTGVGVVDEDTLRYFVPAKDLDRALATYRAGGIVIGRDARIKDGKAEVLVDGIGKRQRWRLPAESTPSIHQFDDFPQAWISPETARGARAEDGVLPSGGARRPLGHQRRPCPVGGQRHRRMVGGPTARGPGVGLARCGGSRRAGHGPHRRHRSRARRGGGSGRRSDARGGGGEPTESSAVRCRPRAVPRPGRWSARPRDRRAGRAQLRSARRP